MIKSILVFSISFYLCFATPLAERTQVHMATFVKVALPQSQQIFFNDAFKTVKDMDFTFSTYKPEAMAYKLNATKYLNDVSDDFLELLSWSQKIYKITEGYFSIAIGSITKKMFKFGERDAKIPSPVELKTAQSDLLGFTVEGRNVTLKPEVTLDFGGIAKGFTVDKVKQLLQRKKLKEFRIGLSGDIYCQGSCVVAVQSPFEPNAMVTLLHLKDSAISTSGNYERYIKSKKYNHLINPKSKKSQQKIASMTLYSSLHSNTLLDALATALAVMPMKVRLHVLSKYPEINYIFITNNKELYHNLESLEVSRKYKIIQKREP